LLEIVKLEANYNQIEQKKSKDTWLQQ
jgi:hypothetical protein